ncbi:MAG: PQQ-binding-like beta-propeller repeat protein [Bacteroidetes bacterium]|nr:PQQ-binding-like beta-propeller repeat protein [Bacteroidota bacterium]MBS1931351.1 PQQ-binding-like beta-propeller repeat protein [Bacteroidota bacterium]
MKKILFILWVIITVSVNAQFHPFRFAFLSDIHIGSPDGKAEEDLKRSIADVNSMKDIAFVVITGDITELGTDEQLKNAKSMLDGFKMKYYIIPGNHDAGWSESGGVSFGKVFGDDKFSFEYDGIRFLGCASGPYVRMSDGHLPRSAINWLDNELKNFKPEQPLIFLNHYPIDNSLDNWYEITDRLRHYNTWAILCGHGHRNKAMNFEDIPGVMGRSNLRAKAEIGGYNLVDVTKDSMIFSERKPGVETMKPWTTVKIETRKYSLDKKFPRPDYSVNEKYTDVKEAWKYTSEANVISTPAVSGDDVMVGNQDGRMFCVSLKTGKEKWRYQTGGSIFSSPAIVEGKIIFGSGDGKIYCLSTKNGKLIWKFQCGASVLGCPVIENNIAYIGASDHHFYALDIISGKMKWSFDGLDGPVVSTPLLYEGKVIFGAWDRNLYALNKNNGDLIWKWNNGSPVRNFSPAACIPVAHDGVVYVVAPDRFITAIDVQDGKTLWRNNDATVRESIGISGDGKWVYGKTMTDTIVAYATSREKQSTAWKMNCGFGYEHVPSMLIEKEGKVFFGTRNGVVYCIDPIQKKIIWAHKIDNSMINTVKVLDGKRLIVSTMDGKVVLLE